MINKSAFGTIDGKQVDLYTITFPGKLTASFTNYGGTVTSLKVPDKDQVMEEVTLGFNALDPYLRQPFYLGALVGRYANRIANGVFSIGDQQYHLEKNNGPNHLHGGLVGFDRVVWEVTSMEESSDSVSFTLKYVSKDGEEGYPGNLETQVIYTFTEDSFCISYQATTDKDTIVNLTQHSYFNLSGDFKENILQHELQLDADQFIAVDETSIPLGGLQSVKDTPFDFTQTKQVGKDIASDDVQITRGKGYDHCWVLNGEKTLKLRKVGRLSHPKSGRQMEVFTTEPGIQLYTGNYLDKKIAGKDQLNCDFRMGLCLETQHYPNSPHHTDFPSVILKVGEIYHSETKYQFGIIEQ
ncbi:MAG: aldose epimerase family protein [Bacteroidota bacterium]